MKKRSTKEKGQEGERLAARFLEGEGFRILDRNYRNRI
jgi:Holliday junction resolvase-like predicted endonuclease